MIPAWANDVYCVLVLVFGVVGYFSPMTVIRIITFWPKFIFPKLFREEDLPPRTREALHLIDEDPKEYAQRFKTQVDVIKFSGLFAVFVASMALLVTAVS